MSTTYGHLIGGKIRTGGDAFDVTNPYDGRVVGQAHYLTEAETEEAIATTAAALPASRALSAAARAAALDAIYHGIEARADEFAELISAENGKPIMWAKGEVARGISTFRWAAEEARRFSGDLQRLDTDPAAAGRMGIIRRFPRGAVLGISPFNFPLNLVAHKIAPAIAAGAPILLKPAPKTPLSALLLGEIIAETDLPPGAVTIAVVPDARMSEVVADPRLPVVSFTGSERVGWMIKGAVPNKHVTLELGGNAAAIIAPDYDDLEWAAQRIATFGNYQAGQSCIGVQRVLVPRSAYDGFAALLVEKVAALKTGDPADPEVVVGPVIDDAAADRIEGWISEAVAGGADLLTGGERDGRTIAPTVLANAAGDAKVLTEEVFGPVLTLVPYDALDDAFELVNGSRFGLQVGIFTRDLQVAYTAHRELEVGGVVIGDVPSFRADQMPYGGVKASGVGREGLRSAMDDFTEERVLVLTGLDL